MTSHRADAPLSVTAPASGPREADAVAAAEAGATSRAGTPTTPAREVPPIYPSTTDHPKWTELIP